MKKKKCIGVALAICLAVLLGSLMLLKKQVDTIELPLALGNHYDTDKVYYGLNGEYLKETSPKHDFLSMTLNVNDLENDYKKIEKIGQESKHLQLILDINDMVVNSDNFELINSEISKLNNVQSIYIYLDYNGDYKKGTVLNHYKIAEEIFVASNIHLVYDHQLYGELDVEYVGVDIHDSEDIETLRSLQNELDKNTDTSTKIIVNDYLVGENEDLTAVLNLVNQLYYNTALYLPSVNWINQQSNLGQAHPRLAEEYDKVLQNNWITREEGQGTNSPYTLISGEELIYIEDWFEILIPTTQELEYIEYKLNEKSLGQVFRYPYKLAYDVENLEDAYNELKIIAKVKDEEKLIVDKIYFKADIKQENTVIKPERTSPTYAITSKISYDHPYIPVLMYHEFIDVVGESDAEQSITVGTQLFEDQIVAMLDAGYTPITFWDLYQYFEGNGGLPEKPVMITTDDGYLSNYLIAYPILKKYNVPATYFITSHYIGVMTTRPHFTWEQAREMEESGLIDIQSHSHSHAPMDTLTEGGVMYQAAHSFELIEKYLGKRDVQVLSYPQFLHNDQTIEWVNNIGVDLQVTNLSKSKSITKPLDIKRIHVSNKTTPKGLIEEIERLTMD